LKTKVIEYYRQNIYGIDREVFCNQDEELYYKALTGKKTLTPTNRRLLRDLSSGFITFREVMKP
jgi:hypothetical protein